jgi:hypothetical protein
MSDVALVQQDYLVTLLDGTGTPVDLGVIYGDKSFTVSDIVNLFEPIVVDAGRTFLGVRKGNRKPISGSFSCYETQYTSAATTDADGSIDDMVSGTNGFSANVSTNTTGYDYYMVDIRIAATLGATTHTLTLAKCTVVLSRTYGEPNKIDVQFECHGGATRSNVTV